jgi:uncharacterized membrane protein
MDLVTIFHIAAGTAALASAPVAILARKGGTWHRGAGLMFTAAMAAMALSGSVIAFADQDRATGLVGLFTFYLVATAWAAAQQTLSTARVMMWVMSLAGLALVAGFAATAVFDPELIYNPAVPFTFAALAALATAGDLWCAVQRTLNGPARTARHLWRMLLAFHLAASSFFLGQQDEFPEAIQGWAIWYAPPLLALVALVYWMVKVRLVPAVQRRRRAAAP